MKISYLVIQNRNIAVNTADDFEATYKGKRINITTNHGFGKPIYDHLTRFDIVVTDIATGLKDVDTLEDLHCMKDAIRHALIGACLLEK